MARAAQRKGFGRRNRQQHVLILASGDEIRHMTVRPWMAGFAATALIVAALGYLGATGYLVMRDNLIGASMARQARMQYDYEDRIAALRAQVDRVTSRQLLDQQVVENKLDSLLEQQMGLSSRSARLQGLMDRDGDAGVRVGSDNPKPDDRAAADPTGGDVGPRGVAMAKETAAERADRQFQSVTLSLKRIEHEQAANIAAMTQAAGQKASAFESVIARTGVRIDPVTNSGDGLGGPLVDADPGQGLGGPFVALDGAINRLDAARATARRMPYANPAPTHEITSPFGNRPDPLLGRLAMHTGTDFRAPAGGQIKAAGDGTVVTAGPTGGYGNMVELDHGQGVTTRYGHMSRILVRPGQKVSVGDIIGLAGSTGRSTGPHLHFEVRRNGAPIDPMGFLTAGLKLNALFE